jgi:hypothetical protein
MTKITTINILPIVETTDKYICNHPALKELLNEKKKQTKKGKYSNITGHGNGNFKLAAVIVSYRGSKSFKFIESVDDLKYVKIAAEQFGDGYVINDLT